MNIIAFFQKLIYGPPTVESLTKGVSSLAQRLTIHAEVHDEKVKDHEAQISLYRQAVNFSQSEAAKARRVAANMTALVEGEIAAI